MIYVAGILCALLLAVAAYSILCRSILAAIVGTSVVSVIAAVLFVILRAPDVAITEAVIGAGLVTAFFLIAVDKTERE